MSTQLNVLEIHPTQSTDFSLIWLHGLGADANDFIPLAHELQSLIPIPLRFVFPNAPFQSITVNHGEVMRAWYDIYSFSSDIRRMDESGLKKSITLINTLIENEHEHGFEYKNIFLAGFSQGAVMALSTALTHPKRLGGVIALSGYLPEAKSLLQHREKDDFHFPIFLAHGTEDNIVPFSMGKAIEEALHEYSYPVTWKAYEMGHSVCHQEVLDLSQWLKQIVS